MQRADTTTAERRAEAARLFLSAAITSSAWLAPTPDVTAMGGPTNGGQTTHAVPLSAQASVLHLLLGDTTLGSRHGLLAAVFKDVVGISLAAVADDAPANRPVHRTLRRANALFGNDASLVLDAAHRRAQFLANVGTPQTAASPAAATYAVAHHAFNAVTPGSPPARRQRFCAPADQPASDSMPGFNGDKASRRLHKRNAGLLPAQRQAAAPADPAASNGAAPAPGTYVENSCIHAISPLTHVAMPARVRRWPMAGGLSTFSTTDAHDAHTRLLLKPLPLDTAWLVVAKAVFTKLPEFFYGTGGFVAPAADIAAKKR